MPPGSTASASSTPCSSWPPPRSPSPRWPSTTASPDLKSFNNRFTETFGRRPAEYRSQVSPEQTVKQITQMNYLDPSLPLVLDKLDAYTRLAADGTGG